VATAEELLRGGVLAAAAAVGGTLPLDVLERVGLIRRDAFFFFLTCQRCVLVHWFSSFFRRPTVFFREWQYVVIRTEKGGISLYRFELHLRSSGNYLGADSGIARDDSFSVEIS
jgi:hypothetical protein